MGTAPFTNEHPVTVWAPNPGPQWALLACPVEDVFFGGQRGGGKSVGLLMHFAKRADRYKKHARGVLMRRSYPELEEIEYLASLIYPGMGARWFASRHRWQWPNGASLRLRYLKRDEDAQQYQGQSFTDLLLDEITQWASPQPLDYLRACLRSAAGVPCVLRASGNPGGPGHNWCKARYIDPAPPWRVHIDNQELPDGTTAEVARVFVPSAMEDNPQLMKNDPNYWQRVALAAGGREDLLKAWRYGIWDIVAGGALDDLWNPAVHVVEPFPIPSSWFVNRSFDWGSSAPFSVCWWAESDGTTAPNGRVYPRGTLFHIAEWYGCTKPNEGVRMLASEVARGIVKIEKDLPYRVQPGAADAKIFSAENGVCIADDMARVGVPWQCADNSPGSRATGLERLRQYLMASLQFPLESPGLFVFSTCRHFIRTVPVLPRDERNPDDVDTGAEDHIYDATRYRLMSPRRQIGTARIQGV